MRLAKSSGAARAIKNPLTNADHKTGADDRDRTGDLVLTKDVLYQLSYVSQHTKQTVRGAGSGNRTHVISLEG